MKVIYIANILGNEKLIKEFIAKRNLGDLILIGGDLCLDPSIVEKPYLAIPGDLDDIHILTVLKRHNRNVDGKVIKKGNLLIAGIGGINPHQSVRLLFKKLNNLKLITKKHVKILVTHFSPYKCLDIVKVYNVRRGLKIINNFINFFKPHYVLYAHPPEPMGVCYEEGVLIANPGPFNIGFYLEIDTENMEASINMLKI